MHSVTQLQAVSLNFCFPRGRGSVSIQSPETSPFDGHMWGIPWDPYSKPSVGWGGPLESDQILQRFP